MLSSDTLFTGDMNFNDPVNIFSKILWLHNWDTYLRYSCTVSGPQLCQTQTVWSWLQRMLSSHTLYGLTWFESLFGADKQVHTLLLSTTLLSTKTFRPVDRGKFPASKLHKNRIIMIHALSLLHSLSRLMSLFSATCKASWCLNGAQRLHYNPCVTLMSWHNQVKGWVPSPPCPCMVD